MKDILFWTVAVIAAPFVLLYAIFGSLVIITDRLTR